MYLTSTWHRNDFTISTDQEKLQIDRIHKFLSEEAYWCLGIPKTTLEKAIRNSICFGVYAKNGDQVGFARLVTDQATFAWLCDVYIEKNFRGLTLSKWLLECIATSGLTKGLRRTCLATRDAHGLYKYFGFEVTQTPQNWMEIKDNSIYLNGALA
jgi:N-acetylglutamate synthase-like GNAT family acetyltransferase